jgi:hypothetical protein
MHVHVSDFLQCYKAAVFMWVYVGACTSWVSVCSIFLHQDVDVGIVAVLAGHCKWYGATTGQKQFAPFLLPTERILVRIDSLCAYMVSQR